jgi:hypothetical protein
MSGATNRTTELIGTLERMLDVLERERRAVADFRLDDLVPIADEKKRTLDELATMASAARSEVATPELKSRSRALFVKVQTQSHANMLLLHSVRKALSASMGLADEGDLYDARARRQSAYTSRAGRAY